MTAYVQTIKKFCEETGLGKERVSKLMDAREIPEIPREKDKGTRLINMIEFRARLEANQFYLRDLATLSNKGEK